MNKYRMARYSGKCGGQNGQLERRKGEKRTW